MEIVRHYSCCANDDICSLLNQNRIPYQQDDLGNGTIRIYFDISENNPLFPQLSDISLVKCIIFKKVKYTKKEICTAQWLTCNPTTAKVNLKNQEISFLLKEQYDSGKARHRVPSGKPFFVSKPLRHNVNQHFFTSDEATNQIFCTEYAKNLLNKQDYPLSFNPVLNSKTFLPIGNLFEVCVEHILPLESMDLSNSEETFTCPGCGAVTFLPPLSLQLRNEYLVNAPAIFRTPSVFSWGGNYSAPITIVSHDVYIFLSESHLTRGLEFEPIIML